MAFQFSTRSKNNMLGVHPDLLMVFNEGLKVSPIDFGIPRNGGVRTALTQNEIYRASDNTKCDGYTRRSRHQVPVGGEYGEALDFFAYVDGAASWQKHHLSMVAGVLLSTAARLLSDGVIHITLGWGGTFDSAALDGWDFPHIYITRKNLNL